MENVTSEIIKLLDIAEHFAGRYQAIIALSGLSLAGLLVRAISTWQKRPDLQWETGDYTPVQGDQDVTFIIRVTNVGSAAAKNVRYTWTPRPRSSLTLKPVPSGFLIRRDEQRQFQFAISGTEVVLDGLSSGSSEPLGIFTLQYQTGWFRSWQTSRAIFSAADPDVPVRLGNAPRRPWGEIITPLGFWQRKWSRFQHTRMADRHLAKSRQFLESREIEVNLIFPRESYKQLDKELWSRGWGLHYQTAGEDIHTVVAEKMYPPSSHFTYRAYANTPLDAITLVLARAVEEDERHSG